MNRYTKLEFAEKEGITEAILNGWIYKHGLPVIQIGKRTYITDEDFDAWLMNHKKVISEDREIMKCRQVEPVPSPRNLKPQKGILGKLRLAR